MNDLTKEEKLKFILEKVEELGFTAYEISKEINLTEAGVSRILKGIAKNPHETSLNEIILFLEKKVTVTEIGKVSEPNSEYETAKNDLKAAIECQKEVNKLTVEIIKLHGLLRKNNIPFTNIFEEE